MCLTHVSTNLLKLFHCEKAAAAERIAPVLPQFFDFIGIDYLKVFAYFPGDMPTCEENVRIKLE